MHKLLRIPKHYLMRLLGRPRTVRILAAGPATRSLCPFDEEAEVWSLNRFWRAVDDNGEPWVKRWDRWFEIHPPVTHDIESEETAKNPHREWLEEEHDFPIYFLQDSDRFPSGVHYPIEKIGPEFDGYLSSSISYMMALAIHEGFDRIELYGVEMPVGSDYFWQRPNMMWLIGLAEGEGIEVFIPPQSSLKGEPMYAYQDFETNYDNRLRAELNTVKRHGRIVEKALKVHKGAVQGVNEVIRNIQEHVPEVLENKTLKEVLSGVLQHYKAKAREYEGAINHFEGHRQRIVEELSYRNTDYQPDEDTNVAGGGTELETAMEIYEEEGGQE